MSEFHVVAKTSEIAPNSIKVVVLDGNEIALANVDGTYLAFGAQCGCISVFVGHRDEEGVDGHFHVGNRGFLPEGTIDGSTVQCPVHKTIYDMRTGEPLSGPGETPVSTYEVRAEGNQISVLTLSDTQRHFWHDDGEKDRPEIEH